MNSFDVIVIVIVGITMAYGLLRGFVREIFSLVSLVLGILAACRYYSLAAHYLSQWVANEVIARTLGFAFCFIAVYLTVGLAGSAVRKLAKRAKLGAEDRLLGSIFGIMKGVLIATGIAIALVAFMPPSHPSLLQSKLLPHLITFGEIILDAIPGECRRSFDEKKHELLESWNNRQVTQPATSNRHR